LLSFFEKVHWHIKSILHISQNCDAEKKHRSWVIDIAFFSADIYCNGRYHYYKTFKCLCMYWNMFLNFKKRLWKKPKMQFEDMWTPLWKPSNRGSWGRNFLLDYWHAICLQWKLSVFIRSKIRKFDYFIYLFKYSNLQIFSYLPASVAFWVKESTVKSLMEKAMLPSRM